MIFILSCEVDMVYFLTDSINVKIGYTKRSAQQRLKELSTGSSTPLYLLGQINNGDLELEKELHMKFKRVNLEWHLATDELIQYINENNDLPLYVDWLNDKLIAYKTMKK
jgi:hypothetical protein